MSHIQVLRQAIEAARAGDAPVARQCLQKAVETGPDDPVVWLWMSWLADSPLRMVQGLTLAGRHEPYREIADSGLRFARALARFDCDALEQDRLHSRTHRPGRPLPAAAAERPVGNSPAGDFTSGEGRAESTDVPPVQNGETDCTDLFARAVSRMTPAGIQWNQTDTREQTEGMSLHEFMIDPAAGEGASPFCDRLPGRRHTAVNSETESPAADTDAAGSDSPQEIGARWPDGTLPDCDSDRKDVVAGYVPPVARAAFQMPAELVSGSDSVESRTTSGDRPAGGADADCEQPSVWNTVWKPPEPVRNLSREWTAGQVGRVAADESSSGIGILYEQAADSRFSSPRVPSRERLQSQQSRPATLEVARSAGQERPAQTQTCDESSAQTSVPGMGEPAEGPVPPETPPVECRTVLVVDSSSTVRNLIQTSLERYGCDVVQAVDGSTAVQEIIRKRPALILMDVSLPKLDGYQLCGLVRRQKSTQHIPVVMLTSRKSLFSRFRGRMAGCSGCLTKPFTQGELETVVQQHLAELVPTPEFAS